MRISSIIIQINYTQRIIILFMKKSTADIEHEILSYYNKKRLVSQRKSDSTKPKLLSPKPQKIPQSPQPNVSQFLQLQKKIGYPTQPLEFRELPRNLKVYFPHPPIPPPELVPIPYTYQIVPNQPVKMPKRKPGQLAFWVLDSMGWRNQKPVSDSTPPKHKFTQKGLKIAKKFQRTVRLILEQVRSRNVNMKEFWTKKIKKLEPYQFYNSKQFFSCVKQGSKQAETLLQSNNNLIYDFDEQFMTPLHWAAREGHTELVKLLTVKYKANVNSKDIYGRTPLHLAVMNQRVGCIYRIFIEGGKLTAQNDNKKSVKDVAPNIYIKYVLEKLEELRFVANSRSKVHHEELKEELERMVRETLDPADSYF